MNKLHIYVPQVLMSGLVIYGPAVALSQGQCTQISHLIKDSAVRSPEGLSAPLSAVVFNPASLSSHWHRSVGWDCVNRRCVYCLLHFGQSTQ